MRAEGFVDMSETTTLLLADLHAHERSILAALEAGDNPVGAVIVRDGEIVSSGAQSDGIRGQRPSARRARRCVADTAVSLDASGVNARCIRARACAMCLGAAVCSAIDRIVWAAADPLCGTQATVACTPYYSRKTLVLLGGVLAVQSPELSGALE